MAHPFSPREPKLHVGEEPDAPMMVPMALHALGVIVVGVAPATAMVLVNGALQPFPMAAAAGPALAPLASAIWVSRGLAATMLIAGVWSWLKGRAARRTATWGCGYTAATPRMQYTGSSFGEQFARIFDAFLPVLRRGAPPEELFPQRTTALATHHADPVERRMYEVLGRGEEYVAQATEKIPEQPRFAFAAGLLALFIIGLVLIGVLR